MLPPFGPIEVHNWFTQISSQQESLKRTSPHLSLSIKSSFDHPASEITCSCHTASGDFLNILILKSHERRVKPFSEWVRDDFFRIRIRILQKVSDPDPQHCY